MVKNKRFGTNRTITRNPCNPCNPLQSVSNKTSPPKYPKISKNSPVISHEIVYFPKVFLRDAGITSFYSNICFISPVGISVHAGISALLHSLPLFALSLLLLHNQRQTRLQWRLCVILAASFSASTACPTSIHSCSCSIP